MPARCRVRQYRSPRHRGRRRPGSRRGHRQGPHRVRARRDRMRGVESADRGDGRREHPADPRRAPDGRCRTDRHPAGEQRGARIPDRP